MMKNKLLLIFMLIAVAANAQQLKVVNFSTDLDTKAIEEHPVFDTNKQLCAVIKVRFAHYALSFKGDVVNAEYRGNNEYWVYVPANAKYLEIICQAATPLTYNYSRTILGGKVYIMQLALTSFEGETLPPPKTFSYEESEELHRFYTIDYSFPQYGWGNSFGVSRRWGWHGNILIRYTSEKHLVLYRRYYYSSVIGDDVYDYSKEKTFVSATATLGPVYHLTQDIYLSSGVGYTYHFHKYLPGGFTMELGVMWNIAESLLLTATYENIGIGSDNASSLRLGVGFIW